MAKKRHTKNRKAIKRQTRHFQLRVEHPIDQHVKEILDFKRSQRSEVTAIRDGIRLLWSLENDDYSVLFELFPHMKSKFTPTPTGGGGDLSEIKTMLELITAQQSSGAYLMQSAQPATPTGNLKALSSAAPPPLPTFEDDDLPTLVTTASKSTDSGSNFLKGLFGLEQPPKAVAAKAKAASADEIADNFLSMFT